MARVETQLKSVGDQVEAASGSIVELQRITAPYTTVVNRALMVDLSKDLMPRMGVERILIQQIMRAENETGSNGVPVWKPVNDKFDQVRFVGSGWTNVNSTSGASAVRNAISGTTDYAEITFYGTGLNTLHNLGGSGYDYRVSIDGGSESANITASNYNTGSSGRSYAAYHVINAASNLSLGLHTVKLRMADAGTNQIMGFEVINDSSSIRLTAGSIWNKGRKLTQAALASSSYNSGFESGTLGTRGGRVVIYKKADGSTGKAVQPVDSSALYLSSASHINEDVIRVYHPREFGVGRSDDFSRVTTTGTTSATYTIDDNSTSLSGSASTAVVLNFTDNIDSTETLYTNGANSYITFTFVGTGLDLVRADAGNGTLDTFSVTIDGTSVGNITGTALRAKQIQKICSGLPYGTHTVKIVNTTYTQIQLGMQKFIVYGPKKPSIPSGAVELADYNIMANYSSTSFTGNTETPIGQGLLRKSISREMVFSGTWSSMANDVGTSPSGHQITATATSSYVEHIFWGTGFEFRGETNTTFSATNTVSLQNLSSGGSLQTLNSTNFPGLTTGNISTGASFTYSTGNLSVAVANTSNSGFYVNGLTLGLYKIRITTGTASSFRIHCFDVITPIHVHAVNGPFLLQNSLSVGNVSIKDSRNFGNQLVKKVQNSQCSLVNTPTYATTSSTFSPFPGMTTSIYLEKDSTVVISAKILSSYNSSQGLIGYMRIYVDGLDIGATTRELTPTATQYSTPSLSQTYTMTLPKGFHTVCGYWATSGGSFTNATFSQNEEQAGIIVSVID